MRNMRPGDLANWAGETFQVLSYNPTSKTYTLKEHGSETTHEAPEEALTLAP